MPTIDGRFRNRDKRVGKPNHRFRFSHQRIQALPEVGTRDRIAKLLHVTEALLTRWINTGGLPVFLESYGNSSRYVIRKQELVPWLVATKRYTPRKN